MVFPECFMIANWYPVLKKHTIKTKLVEIHDQLLKYIHDEHFIHPTKYFTSVKAESELDRDINNCIKDFGGKTYAKLLWSSPKDSGWLTCTGKPMMTSFNDLCLMLKNSERLQSDIDYILSKPNISHCMAIRKWVEIDESLEFRCFIKDSRLIACCQRSVGSNPSYVEENQNVIIRAIKNFIFNTFFLIWKHETSLVLDIFLNYKFKVKVMDIGPFDSAYVESLLFKWNQLENWDKLNEMIFRLNPVPDCFVCLNKNNNNGVPIEFLNMDLVSDGNYILQLREFMKDYSKQ